MQLHPVQKIHANTALCLPAKGSRISPVLNKVTLMGISNDECKKIYGRKKIIDSIICVKSVNNNGAGTCQVSIIKRRAKKLGL